MTFDVPFQMNSLFQFSFGKYNLVGNISWYNSCMATTVWVGTVLQLFIHAKHPPLSRAESSYLFLVSFPCHFSSPSVSQLAFYCAVARVVLSFFPPISSPSSVVALGLRCCKVRVKCSSVAYFSASSMIGSHPICTAFSSNFFTALMVVSEFSNNFTAALIFLLYTPLQPI